MHYWKTTMDKPLLELELILLRRIDEWAAKSPYESGQAKNCASDLAADLRAWKLKMKEDK